MVTPNPIHSVGGGLPDTPHSIKYPIRLHQWESAAFYRRGVGDAAPYEIPKTINH